ncbi:hypothetical protein MRX96_001733 [Rhipicephalus microplus]
MSWWMCVPVAKISLLLAFLVLLSLTTMVRTNHIIASVVTIDRVDTYHNRKKAVSSVPVATMKPLLQSKSTTKTESTKLHGSETTSVVRTRNVPSEAASYPLDTETEVRKPVPSSNRITRHRSTAMYAAVPRTPSRDRADIGNRRNSGHYFAFPFQYLAKRKQEAPKCRTALSPVVSAKAAVEMPSEPSSPAKDWYRSKAEESAQEVLQLKKKVKTLQQSKKKAKQALLVRAHGAIERRLEDLPHCGERASCPTGSM